MAHATLDETDEVVEGLRGTTDQLALTVSSDPDAVDREEFASSVRSVLNISADALTMESDFEASDRVGVDDR